MKKEKSNLKEIRSELKEIKKERKLHNETLRKINNRESELDEQLFELKERTKLEKRIGECYKKGYTEVSYRNSDEGEDITYYIYYRVCGVNNLGGTGYLEVVDICEDERGDIEIRLNPYVSPDSWFLGTEPDSPVSISETEFELGCNHILEKARKLVIK